MYKFINIHNTSVWRFVYNTEDKSVRYLSSESFSKLDITSNLDSSCIDLPKLRLLGFTKIVNSPFIIYKKLLCEYYLSVSLCAVLSFMITDKIYICIAFFDKDNIISGISLEYDGSILSSYGFSSMFPVKLEIPVDMVYYLMYLRSVGDFSGILEAFDGLFDIRVADYVRGFTPEKPVLKGWGD